MAKKVICLRASAETMTLLGLIAASLEKKTGVAPKRTQVIELAIRVLAKAQKVSK